MACWTFEQGQPIHQILHRRHPDLLAEAVALGGKVGYDFVGPRVEVEGMYHSNTGSAVVAFPTGYATVSGRIEQGHCHVAWEVAVPLAGR
jgi:hypothetical protein